MMRNDFNEYLLIAKLIARRVLGLATDDEIERISNWKQKSKDNAHLYHTIEEDTTIVNIMERLNQNDISVGRKKLNARIHRSYIPRIGRIYIAAASIAILIIVTVLHKFISTEREQDQIVLATAQNITLTLSSGQKISIGNIDTTMSIDSSLSIKTNKAGSIEYVTHNIASSDNQNTISTPFGKTCKITLPDGSLVWLNAQSSLKYAVAMQKKRTVTLEGEAYFEIKHIESEGKKVGFEVNTNRQKIEVTGTHFNVSAYGTDKIFTTTLLEGHVIVTDNKIQKKQYLEPSLAAISNENNLYTQKANVTQSIAWKEGIFEFYDTPIEVVMQQFSRWYGIAISFSPNFNKKIHYTGIISHDDDINTVLKSVESTANIHILIKDNTAIIEP